MKQLLQKFKTGRALSAFLAVVLTLSVLLSSFVGMPISAEDPEIDVWDGTAVAPTIGDGSATNPTLISNPEEFAYVMQSGGAGKHYKITTDIYLNNINKISWDTGAITQGYSLKTWTPTTFNGNIDGDGHVVYGLYINQNPAAYTNEGASVGLISKVNGSVELKNLGIDNVYINADATAGAFVGTAGSGSYGGRIKMDNCYAGQYVYIKASAAGAFVGWGAFGNPGTGQQDYAVLDSCYSLANLTGVKYNSDDKMSLLGGAWGGYYTASHCYSLTYVVPSVGANCNNNYSAKQGSASSTAVALRAKADMMGTDVLTASSKMPNLGSEYVATVGYPALSVFVPQIEVDDDVWDKSTKAPTEGDGSSESPKLISSAEQFAYVMNNGGEGKHYKLTADIYLNEVKNEYVNWQTGDVTDGYEVRTWTPKAFNGTIDGDGHIVYGLYINTNPAQYNNDNNPVGLITKPNGNAIFTNIGIDCMFIDTDATVGAFAGVAGSRSQDGGRLKVSNSFVGENVTLIGVAAGAFVGWGNYGAPASGQEDCLIIDTCYSLATITGKKYSSVSFYGAGWGGYTTITKCYATHDIASAGVANKSYSTTTAVNGGPGYATYITKVEDAQIKGEGALTKMPNLGGAFVDTNSYPMLSIFVPKDTTDPNAPTLPEGTVVWDGGMDAPAGGGAGTPEDPAIINTARELAYVMYWSGGSAGKYWKLGKDIYLNDITKIDWATGERTDSQYIIKNWSPKNFKAVLDGNGHTIYGLYINTKPTSYTNVNNPVGLISKPDGTATFKNLGIDYMYVDADGTVGAFAGRAGSGSSDGGRLKVTNSYVGENVKLTGVAVGSFAGWGSYGAPATGQERYLVVDTCYSLATLTGKGHSATHFYGAGWGGYYTINNCYAISTVGEMDEITNCYSATKAYKTYVEKVEIASIQGANALGAMPNLSDDFVATTKYPALSIFPYEAPGGAGGGEDPDGTGTGGGEPGGPGTGGGEPTIDPAIIWDGSANTQAATEGDGTEENPYIIKNAKQFYHYMYWGYSVANDLYLKLDTDIYLNAPGTFDPATGVVADGKTVNTWSAKKFRGTIDGNGHTIYGLYTNENPASYGGTSTYYGLFSQPVSGRSITIKNLGMDDLYINANGAAAAFVAFTNNSTGRVNISNCYLGKNATIKATAAGAFLAWGGFSKPAQGEDNYLIIDTCYSLANLQGSAHNNFYGGAWGGWYTITNSYATHKIAEAGAVENCYSTAAAWDSSVTLVEDADIKGAQALQNMPKLTNAFVTTDSYPVLFVFTPAASEKEGAIWSGRVAIGFEKGTGEKTNPYIISNGAELALAITSSNYKGKYFKLTKDIYLNDVAVDGWENSATNNQWVNAPGFDGHIDGDGHIVYGVWFPADTKNVTSALIACFNKGTIEKLGVRKSFINATHTAGGLVGMTRKGGAKVIDQCFVDETVRVEYTIGSSGIAAGGIVAYAETDSSVTEAMLTISNCYSKAVLVSLYDQAFRANGIIGTAWKNSYVITNCYSYGEPPMAADSAGNTSYLYKGADDVTVIRPMNQIFKNLYTDKRDTNNEFEHFTALATENMCGNNARTYMPGLDYTGIFQIVANGTPKLKVFTSIDGADIAVQRNDLYASGTGTKDDPYIIRTKLHLRNLMKSTDTKGKYYSLANDIYLNDVSDPNWTENNPEKWREGVASNAFAGTFQGNGYTVYGIYYNDKPKDYPGSATFKSTFVGVGLFPSATGDAVIKNVHVRSSYISGRGYVGSIVGYASVGSNGRAKIIGCSADETVSLYGESVGGIVGGGGKGVVLNYCYFTGNIIFAALPYGKNGMVGDIWNTNQEVAQCYSAGYQNYNTIPSYIEALYGTVKNDGTTVLTKEQMTGAEAKKYMTQLNWDVWSIVDGKTPQLRVVKDEELITFTYEGEVGKPWSGMFAPGFAGGSGTEKDPYLIETPEQLAYLVAAYYSKKDEYYKIVADIIINDTSYQGWERNAKNWFGDYLVFRGHLDGNGHIVSGLYYNVGGGKTALIPVIAQNATVKRVGLINSTIINPKYDGSEGYTGGIVAYVHHWAPDAKETDVMPKISESFVDHTVTIEGQYVGGIVGAAGSPIAIENCYCTANLLGEEFNGGLLGNSWMTKWYHKFANSYVATANRNPIGQGSAFTGAGDETYKNIYVDGSKGQTIGVSALSLMYMKGNIAKQHMAGFDFNNVWKTIEGGTPVLRCFPNAEKYSCKREPTKLEISFATGEGSKCESIYGYPRYSEVPELPTPTRYGYKFGGWYCFIECDIPFTEKLFPDFNTILYAKWIPLGFTNGFEANLDSKYDYNDAVEHARPGVKGYMPTLIHNGLKAMHTLPDAQEDALILLNYEDVLEVGKVYEVNYWISAGSDGQSGKLEFLHANHPQYNSDLVGYESVLEFEDLKKGKWTEYKYTFTANSPYIVLKVSKGADVYIDDVQFVLTEKEGELGLIESIGSLNAGLSVKTILYIAIAAAVAAILIAGAIVITTGIRKKKRT